jgi:hypothetical protein
MYDAINANHRVEYVSTLQKSFSSSSLSLFLSFFEKKVGHLRTSERSTMSSARDPVATVAAAYDPSVVPALDRMLDLVETPLGAMALLTGLKRLREGGPLDVLVPEVKARRVICALELNPWTAFEVRPFVFFFAQCVS